MTPCKMLWSLETNEGLTEENMLAREKRTRKSEIWQF